MELLTHHFLNMVNTVFAKLLKQQKHANALTICVLVSSGSALFTKTKSIFRERNNLKIFLNLLPVTPQYMQWTILTSLYKALWQLSLVHKRLSKNTKQT